MSVIIQRTCTEVLTSTEAQRREPITGPLELFSSAPAYVLLGDPGSGKSTTFGTEAAFLGTDGALISARDFLASDVRSHPEWQGKTLFIDGLDEMRVGSGDRREALDSIRRSLDALGRPAFRISCREADWLGDNDRDKLAMVSPDASVKVLRLNPLTDGDVARILEANPHVDDAHRFVSEARERGVDALLRNPLTLNMLAAAVGKNDVWPQSRLETFEMACFQMVRERNREHSLADPPPPDEQLLDAAGRLCAYQLLSGAAGWSPVYDDTDTDFISVNVLEPWRTADADHALSSRLFTGFGADGGRVTPVHRQIAEFLGARYLARLIEDGLPAGRVVQLITAGDGMVVTVFRGLSAWLAALCPAARHDLIGRDPVGVGLYGDLRRFSTDDRRRLLASLNREVADYAINVAAFAPLAAPDMELAIRDLLNDPRRDTDHQAATDLLLRVLRYGQPMAELAPVLFDAISDDTRWPRVNKAALDAFIHTTWESADGTGRLRQILLDIVNGTIADPDNELLGSLLVSLYPREISPSEIWSYLTAEGNANLIGAYFVFWERRLMEQSSDQDIAELLDCLSELMPALRATFRMYYLDHLPTRLLARALERLGDEQATVRLFNWLSAATYPFWDPPALPDGSAGRIRVWLERRLDIQKSLLLEGLSRYPDDERFDTHATDLWELLQGSALPDDIGLWCLETAVAWADVHPRAADYLLRRAFYLCGQEAGGRGLTQPVLKERTLGHEALERLLTELLQAPPHIAPPVRERNTASDALEADTRRRQWVENIRPHADALRENRANPRLLFDLARVHLGGFSPPVVGLGPGHGLSGVLGDDELLEAAMAGLRGTVSRHDVPEVAEIVQLFTESKFHPLSLPFLVGMDEMDRDDHEDVERLSQLQRRQALAFHYCSPTGLGSDGDPPWYRRWLGSRPDLVAEVLVQCAVPAIRAGEGFVPELYQLVHDKNYAQVAAQASLKLLAAFPLRCRLHRLETLDSLLWAALQYADRATLLEIIQVKLSRSSLNVAQRIHWLAAGVVVDPEFYLRPLERLVAGKDDQIRKMAAIFSPDESLPFLVQNLGARTLQTLISLMGRTFEPNASGGWVTAEMRAADQVDQLIRQLASLSSSDAALALDALVDDEALSKWRPLLERVRDQQRVIHRDASYRQPTVEQVRGTLSNKAPANVGDLAALVADQLDALAGQIRGNNTDDWHQYWNEDRYGRPLEPKHEDRCRDVLLSSLRDPLSRHGVDAQPEGQCADDNRSDIRVSYGAEFNVPVEIKKDRHPKLWSALRDQLIARYVSYSTTGGHGIYLVFWFGDGKIPPPPQGRRPTVPAKLRQQLEEQLTEAERRRITVRVIDVSPSGKGRSS